VSSLLCQASAAYNGPMSDVIFIAVVLAFFALTALYVRLCDNMLGPDEMTTDTEPEAATTVSG